MRLNMMFYLCFFNKYASTKVFDPTLIITNHHTATMHWRVPSCSLVTCDDVMMTWTKLFTPNFLWCQLPNANKWMNECMADGRRIYCIVLALAYRYQQTTETSVTLVLELATRWPQRYLFAAVTVAGICCCAVHSRSLFFEWRSASRSPSKYCFNMHNASGQETAADKRFAQVVNSSHGNAPLTKTPLAIVVLSVRHETSVGVLEGNATCGCSGNISGLLSRICSGWERMSIGLDEIRAKARRCRKKIIITTVIVKPQDQETEEGSLLAVRKQSTETREQWKAIDTENITSKSSEQSEQLQVVQLRVEYARCTASSTLAYCWCHHATRTLCQARVGGCCLCVPSLVCNSRVGW